MKKLYIEIATVVVLFFLVISLLECLYKDYTNDFDQRFKLFEEKKADVDYIYIGNSHMGALEFNADSGKTAFNFSFGGQDLFHMMILLKKIIPESPKLKKVILGCDYDLLGYNYKIANQIWKDRQYYPYTGVLYDNSFSNVLMARSNFFRANRELKYLFKSTGRQQGGRNEIRFIPMAMGELSIDDCEQRAFEHSFVKYDGKLVTENIAYLKEIANWCNEYKVELLIINPPKRKCYWDAYNQEIVEPNAILLRQLSQEYGFGYLDFYMHKEFTNGDFVDYDHLNNNGVKKLIIKIYEY